MSFDEIVAELPKLTGPELQQIAEREEFLAGLYEGLRQIAEGKLIPHEEMKEEFRSWLTGSSRRPSLDWPGDVP
jgi:predicted transcriptional regulator